MSYVLHGYWRSSAAYRVRIALNLKGLDWVNRPVSLVKQGGEHKSAAFADLNPQKLVPVLEGDRIALTQSLAILEYLDEMHPAVPLLPGAAAARARVRALALAVACEIHPLGNLRVLAHLTGGLGLAPAEKDAWARHRIREGLEAVEAMLTRAPETGTFCHGETPTLADICLVPQVYNARRLALDLASFPTVEGIDAACRTLPAFAEAAPERQPDAA